MSDSENCSPRNKRTPWNKGKLIGVHIANFGPISDVGHGLARPTLALIFTALSD
jgi:mannose/fructose/N-acetylgalactosamine-specific phosphotransferase system component IID